MSWHLQVLEIFPTLMESSSCQCMVFNILFISLAVVSTEQSWPKAFQTKEELFHFSAVRNGEEFRFHRFCIRGYFLRKGGVLFSHTLI